MGIFSHDEEPDWNDIFNLQRRIEKYKELLQWIKECINNYFSEENINNINPMYYKEWMLNVRNKIIGTIEDNE